MINSHEFDGYWLDVGQAAGPRPGASEDAEVRLIVVAQSRLTAEAIGCALVGEGTRVAARTYANSEPIPRGTAAVLLAAGGPTGEIAGWMEMLRPILPDLTIVLLFARRRDIRPELVRALGATAWTSRDMGRSRILATCRTGVSPDAPRPPTESSAGGMNSLTQRQNQVLGCLGSGMKGDQIAEHLGISAQTVRTHIQNIMMRLGVASRLEAVSVANRAGLLGPGDVQW